MEASQNDYVTFRHHYRGEDPVLIVGRVDGPLRKGRDGLTYPVVAHGEQHHWVALDDIVAVRQRPSEMASITVMLQEAGIPGHLYLDDIRSPLPKWELGRMQSLSAGLWRVEQLRDGGDEVLRRIFVQGELATVQDIVQGWAMGDWAPAPDALVPPSLEHARIQPYAVQKAANRSRIPRALCPFCGGNPAMTAKNTVRNHSDLRKRGVHGHRPECPGSGEPSAGLEVAPK